MRATVAQLLANDPVLNTHGITNTSMFAGDVDTPEPRRYIVLRWGETTPGVGYSNRRNLTIWIHDRPGDYATIDKILKRIRNLFDGTVAVATDNGGWITQLDWVVDSEDLSDDITRTIMRTTTYAIVASGI